MNDDFLSAEPRLELGPMVVVCPELAMDARMDRVALQATAFCDWPGPLFFLGGLVDDDELDRPWQIDYLNALGAMLDAGATRYLCGSNPTDLAAGTRMMLRSRAFRAASDRGCGKVMLTGAMRETEIAAVAATLRAGGLMPIGSTTAIGAAEIGRGAPRRMRA
jgi:hypothetical protein